MSGLERPAVHPLVAAGFVAWAASGLAWLWVGDWRWAVTGLIVLLISAVASGVRR